MFLSWLGNYSLDRGNGVVEGGTGRGCNPQCKIVLSIFLVFKYDIIAGRISVRDFTKMTHKERKRRDSRRDGNKKEKVW